MPCSPGTVSYTVQSGDTLYRIASMFNTTVQSILSVNSGMNPNVLYIGQQICVPLSQAVAQIADKPVIVNNVNINTGLYPVLNYRPPNAQYPYIYVPIAEFSRVGAKVSWDEAKQLLTVTTDYYDLKNTISQQQSKITDLEEQIKLCNKTLVKFEGIVDGYYKFSGVYWTLGGNVVNFTVGKYYEVVSSDAGMGRIFMVVLNDNNQEVLLSRSGQASPIGIVYIGKAEDGLYNFAWEQGGYGKFRILSPSSGEVSLIPNRLYVAVKYYEYPGYEGIAYQIVGTDVVILPVG